MENTGTKGSNPGSSKGDDDPLPDASQIEASDTQAPDNSEDFVENSSNVSAVSESLLNGQPENTDYKLISELSDLSNNMTKDMFINQIIADHADLEDVRLRVYEAVKASDGYPYDLNVELKKRKNSYGGQNKMQKLAKDIHTLIQVLEGAEFHELRQCLSTSQNKGTNLDSSILNSGITNNAEIECLKTVINSMRADILTLKQDNKDIKTNMAKDVKELKDSVKKIKAHLELEIRDVREEVQTNAISIDRIVDEKSNGNAALKTDIRLIKNDIKEINDALSSKVECKRVESMNEKHAQLIRRVSKLEKNTKHTTNIDRFDGRKESETINTRIEEGQKENEIQTSVQIEIPLRSSMVVHDTEESTRQNEPTSDKDNRDSVYDDRSNMRDDERDRQFGERSNKNTEMRYHPNKNINNEHNSQEIIEINDRSNRYYHDNRSENRQKKSNNLSKYVDRSSSNNRYNRKNNSNEENDRFSRSSKILRGRGSRRERVLERDEDDFSKYVQRRVKRFYVGGFKNNITTDALIDYVEEREVTVTWVTIFPIRNSNRVLIRLNVEDNDNSEYVTDKKFWPRFVVCKPWVPKSTRDRERDNKDSAHRTNDNDNNYDENRNDLRDYHYGDRYNRYDKSDNYRD